MLFHNINILRWLLIFRERGRRRNAINKQFFFSSNCNQSIGVLIDRIESNFKSVNYWTNESPANGKSPTLVQKQSINQLMTMRIPPQYPVNRLHHLFAFYSQNIPARVNYLLTYVLV